MNGSLDWCVSSSFHSSPLPLLLPPPIHLTCCLLSDLSQMQMCPCLSSVCNLFTIKFEILNLPGPHLSFKSHLLPPLPLFIPTIMRFFYFVKVPQSLSPPDLNELLSVPMKPSHVPSFLSIINISPASSTRKPSDPCPVSYSEKNQVSSYLSPGIFEFLFLDTI